MVGYPINELTSTYSSPNNILPSNQYIVLRQPINELTTTTYTLSDKVDGRPG